VVAIYLLSSIVVAVLFTISILDIWNVGLGFVGGLLDLPSLIVFSFSAIGLFIIIPSNLAGALFLLENKKGGVFVSFFALPVSFVFHFFFYAYALAVANIDALGFSSNSTALPSIGLALVILPTAIMYWILILGWKRVKW